MSIYQFYNVKKIWILLPIEGGTLILSSYVGSGPASTIHPKKYKEFQHLKKIFEILETQKVSVILYLDLKKRP